MNKKEKISLTLNIIIFLMALFGSILCFGEIYFVPTEHLEHGIRFLKFFTVQSNILAGITVLIYIIFVIRKNKTNKPIPISVRILRYIATIDLIITFSVVALFLGFLAPEGYFSMFVNANFFFHFAIPILNLISFLCFEDAPKLKPKHILCGMSHLLLYSVFYLTVVLTHFKDGHVDLQYDWYAFAQKGLLVAFACAIVVITITYIVALILYKINNKKSVE